MSETISYKNMCNAGNLIASLAGIRQFWKDTGRKAIIYQVLDVYNYPYEGFVHPVQDKQGKTVCMNLEMFNMLKPLIVAQEYVEDYRIWAGEEIEFDLDKTRSEANVNLPYTALQNVNAIVFPQLQANLAEAWMIAEEKLFKPNVIVINFTERYRNPYISYFFLKKYIDNLVFIGTEKECELFCEKWILEIPRPVIKDWMEIAWFLEACKFCLCNQSAIWNLCEAMKIPRILEICPQYPNCVHGIGEHSYGFLHQAAAEYYVDKLFNL